MKTTKPNSPVSLPRMSAQESAEYRARQDAVIQAGVIQIMEDQQKLIRLGILDSEGNRMKPFVPPVDQSGEEFELIE